MGPMRARALVVFFLYRFFYFFLKNQVDTTRVSNSLDPYQDKYHIGVGRICASSDFCSLLIFFCKQFGPRSGPI